MMIIGIDPGMKGAIAFRRGRGVTVRPLPVLRVTKNKRAVDEVTVRQILEHRRSAIQHVYIEKVQSMPGQGIASAFNFGAGWGLLRGICVGLHLPYTLVHPTTWKRVMCKDMPKGTKDVAILVAKRLFPDVSLKRTARSTKDDDGLADALCIAEYGRRQLGVH